MILDTFTFTSFHCHFLDFPAGEEGEQVAGQGRGGRKEVGKPPGLVFMFFFFFLFAGGVDYEVEAGLRSRQFPSFLASWQIAKFRFITNGWMEQALEKLVFIIVLFQTTAEQQIEEQRIRFKKVNP